MPNFSTKVGAALNTKGALNIKVGVAHIKHRSKGEENEKNIAIFGLSLCFRLIKEHGKIPQQITNLALTLTLTLTL